MRSNIFSRNRLIFALFIVALGSVLTTALSSCDIDTRSEIERGQALYIAYCQICHGEQGDGPMADLMNVQPPNLTTINQRYGGEFPDEHIVKQIEGKERILGHSDTDMPVFWVAIKNGENLQTDEQVSKRIDNLVAYLRSIQKS